MNLKIKNLIKACSIKEIAILSGGTFIAQLIGMAVQPIATRLYSPKDFGVLNLILSLISMFTPLLVFQYDACIITAKTDGEADKATALCFYLLLNFVIVFSVGLVIYNLFYPQTFVDAGLWIYVAIPLMLFIGINGIVDYYNNRYGQYGLMSKIAVYRASISNISKIGLGFSKIGYIGLIIATFIAFLFGMKKQARFLIENKKRIFSTSFIEVKKLAIKNIAQPLFSAPGLFVVGYAYSIIPFHIKSLYNSTVEVGIYSLSTAMLGIPMNLVSGSMGKVFFRNASREMHETGGFRKSFKSTTIFLATISILPFVVLYFVAEPIFSFVFGVEWARCGVFVQCLIPVYFANFIANAVISGLIICGAQKTKLMIQLLFLVSSLGVFLISKVLALPIETFLIINSIGYAIVYCIMLLFIYEKSKPKLIGNR